MKDTEFADKKSWVTLVREQFLFQWEGNLFSW